MQSASDPTTKDFVTWVFTAISLGFTAFTFWYARKSRRDAFALDEWKLERGELLRAVRDFESEIDLLHSLTSGAHQIGQLREQLSDRNQKIAVAHRKLVREAERATVLKLPPALAYGAEVDQESAWDRLNQSLADIALMDDAAQVRARLVNVATDGRSITLGIDTALNAQRETRSQIR